MAQRQIMLTPVQRQELIRLRDTADKPYLRERAAAILKVADGTPAAVVARQGLLRQRKPDTIYDWLNRFHDEGIAGLSIRPGRGRKPAFSAEGGRHSQIDQNNGEYEEEDEEEIELEQSR